MPDDVAAARVSAALDRWKAPDAATARAWAAAMQERFPDHEAPDQYWHSAAQETFRGFFTWGHDHDFGHGVQRSGAMGPRHCEIVAECLSLGYVPDALAGARVLDVGCWSGGDALILAGMGAKVTAVEEHPLSAKAASGLFELVGADIDIHVHSLYSDRQDWAGAFDVVYASGVIYHVTDPLLFARLCFAYLKPGGRVVLETKASDAPGSVCGYSGTLEKGWNWYAPNVEAMGRWLVDAGFPQSTVGVSVRSNGRLLASAVKTAAARLPETAGFSRPGSWLEGVL
jgi:2-polyprenyl-3-methyl-5-hydroxy-6-metoxy-1,4-benzoquinol methylase